MQELSIPASVKEALAIGETGQPSIRLSGLKVEDLPWWIREGIKRQIALMVAEERKTRILEVLATHPTYRADYLKSKIEECRKNIKVVAAHKVREQGTVEEYSILIAQCAIRDRELEGVEDPAKIKAIKKKYPPYNVPAMETQITQCREAMKRCDEVIAKDRQSLEEIHAVRGQCQIRDSELRKLGVNLTAW